VPWIASVPDRDLLFEANDERVRFVTATRTTPAD
jgi:hypothetical protein